LVSELGGSQISSLLETLPGIANVLRSPVADALVGVMRAGAKLAEFRYDDADELVKYAVRRGLMNGDEGDRLLAELREVSEPGTGKTGRPAPPPKAVVVEPTPSAPPQKAPVPAKAVKPAPVKPAPAVKPVKAAKPAPAARPVKPPKAARPTARPAAKGSKPAPKPGKAKAVKAKPAKASRPARSSRPVKAVRAAKPARASKSGRPVKKAARSGRKR
jgi:hypothetical protein